ncbi:MAG: CoA pyrophosphatase [Leptolyngbya sp. SIO3F4]|nr:CoA pyrophosphatase [Leptolyngbya sp. SIO3F4]
MHIDHAAVHTFLRTRLTEPLPEETEQLRMAPYNRTARNLALRVNPNPKPSAVLVLIYPHGTEAHTVLMLRNKYPGVHSGQVSFPGGRQEITDPDLRFTALRETEEEMGVPVQSVEVLGSLSPVYIPPSGFLVTPYVGTVLEAPHFRPDDREVHTLIETPLSLLLRDDIIKSKPIKVGSSGIRIRAPYFDVHGHVVWGATAMILSELKSLLHDERLLP